MEHWAHKKKKWHNIKLHSAKCPLGGYQVPREGHANLFQVQWELNIYKSIFLFCEVTHKDN